MSTATLARRRGRSSPSTATRLVVAAGDGAVAIRVVRAGGDKTAAGDYARAAGVEPGARLGGGERSAG